MALLDDINQKIALIGECVDDIGEAANIKGAGIDLEYDKLDKWAEKILAMDVPVYKIYGLTSDSALNIVMGDKFTYPSTMVGTEPPSRTFQIAAGTATNGMAFPLFTFERVTIPEYYETSNIVVSGLPLLPNTTTGTTSITVAAAPLKYLNVKTRFNTKCRIESFGYLREINFPEITDNNSQYLDVIWNNNTAYRDNLPILISAPKFTYTLRPGIHSYNASGSMKPIRIDAPYASSLGCATYSGDSRCTLDGPGQFCMNSLRSLICFWIPTDASAVLEMRFPRITSINSPSHGNYGTSTHIGSGRLGTTNCYLGPNLASFNIYGYSTSDTRIIFHIPAGDSTTKTTLTTAGVSFVQDYNYEPDMVEGA